MQPAPLVDHSVPQFNVIDINGQTVSPDILLSQPFYNLWTNIPFINSCFLES